MPSDGVHDSIHDQLRVLAGLHGIQPSYEDRFGGRCEASMEALLGGLQALGVPIRGKGDVSAAIRERRQASWRRRLEPATVAWDGAPSSVALRHPSSDAQARLGGTIVLESGESRDLVWDLGKLAAAEVADIEGVSYVVVHLPLPSMPMGCHQLTIDLRGRALHTLVISAPRRAYTPAPALRTWGVFLPLYALHSSRSWGAGDFADLERLFTALGDMGGGVVATLPLLAAFLDEPLEVSPYSPASRLFWNEFYLAVDRIPEMAACPTAAARVDSAEFQRVIESVRSLPLVDYRRQMVLKRSILSELSREFFRNPRARREAYEGFLRDHPLAEDYARFRAVGERLRTPWPQWPAALRDGTIQTTDYDDEARRYHLFVQWQADEQLRALAEGARRSHAGLYLDLPLGVNENGYDTWRERSAFALDAAGGCPPDPGFPLGQNWGFAPLHPEGIREQQYRYVRAFLRHQFQYAGILRIDHMPVFHRLYWVPRGLDARDGVYVRYHAEELYALFNLESHRSRTVLVGEDLGTVPPEVPESMARHNVQRMYVVQYELQPEPQNALAPVPAGAVASLNTHDMAPFASYVQGLDIAQRNELGLLGDQDPDHERRHRQTMIDALTRFLGASPPATAGTLLQSCLSYLANSDASVVLVSLEDLWEETQPQNVPSTVGERPNWRQKARYSLEQFLAMPQVRKALRDLDQAMKKT